MICYKMEQPLRRWLIGLFLLVGVGVLMFPLAASSWVKPRLGRPPTTCPGSAPLQQSNPGPGWGQLLGTSPLWLWVYARVDERRAKVTVPAPRSYRRKKRGWPVKILWVVPRQQTAPITVSFKRLSTGTPVWVSYGGLFRETTTTPVLDPARPGHPDDPSRPATHEWGSTVYFPRAGCYSFSVSWSGGSRGFVFAFGRKG
jgi:hypothetical protein